jgi:hypothetical protein
MYPHFENTLDGGGLATGMRLTPKTRENKKMMPPRSTMMPKKAIDRTVVVICLTDQIPDARIDLIVHDIRFVSSKRLTPIDIIQCCAQRPQSTQQRVHTAQESNHTERGKEKGRWQVHKMRVSVEEPSARLADSNRGREGDDGERPAKLLRLSKNAQERQSLQQEVHPILRPSECVASAC